MKPPSLALNTATPVFGSATAEMSDAARRPHALVGTVSTWNDGSGMRVLHVLPALDHAVSVQPRVVLDLTRCVPPTANTCADVLGKSPAAPVLPLSPLDTNTLTFWVWVQNCASSEASLADDPPPQLLLIATTPARAAAVFCSLNRSLP